MSVPVYRADHRQLSEMLEINALTLHGWVRKHGLPCEKRGLGRKSNTYCLNDVLKWAVYIALDKKHLTTTLSLQEHEEVKDLIAGQEEGQDPERFDEMLLNPSPDIGIVGSALPWLEELRKEKTREAKRKNDEAEGILVKKVEVEMKLAVIAKRFSDKISFLERDYGTAGVEASASIRQLLIDLRSEFDVQ